MNKQLSAAWHGAVGRHPLTHSSGSTDEASVLFGLRPQAALRKLEDENFTKSQLDADNTEGYK